MSSTIFLCRSVHLGLFLMLREFRSRSCPIETSAKRFNAHPKVTSKFLFIHPSIYAPSPRSVSLSRRRSLVSPLHEFGLSFPTVLCMRGLCDYCSSFCLLACGQLHCDKISLSSHVMSSLFSSNSVPRINGIQKPTSVFRSVSRQPRNLLALCQVAMLVS